MNYRHAYHAGNFADVVKHAVIARLVEYLKLKDKAFRVVDTHAGVGMYALSSMEAGKTGEWKAGIGRVFGRNFEPPVDALLGPYLAAVRAANQVGLAADRVGLADRGGDLEHYPGSPWIVRYLLRRQDRLSAIELHPDDFAELEALFAGDFQVRTIELDGWLALGAHLPPKEKRGLVIVDPAFEQASEFDRLVDGLAGAYRRWPGGTYALWYPIKDRGAVEDFRTRLAATGIPKLIDIRFEIRAPSREKRLDGSGMVVVNPPYTLEAELQLMLPALLSVLREGPGATAEVIRIAE